MVAFKMVLGIDKVMKLIREENLIEHLSEKEPEGVEHELRVGEVLELNHEEPYSLHIKKRKLPEGKSIGAYKEGISTIVQLQPGTYYQLKTIEVINTPSNIFPQLAPRTTLQRSGISLFFSTTAPGYKGPLTVGAFNYGKNPFELELGSHILKISFHEVQGTSILYPGQWQHGRTSTGGKTEEQTGFKS